ncbi:DNA-deoxyinosine glycosylase [Acidovorax temperans]
MTTPQEPAPLADAAVTPASEVPMRLVGLPPVVSDCTVVLVLGSFPGAASLKAQQYYGHPQNHFWRILQSLWPQHPLPPAGPQHYAQRCAWLLERRLGLWDVYASCEREGSLDTSIRHAVVNDFAQLLRECPGLRAIAHNGGESFKHSAAVRQQWAGAYPGAQVQSVRLPSTSPANASWSFERKQTAWAELMAAHGLL